MSSEYPAIIIGAGIGGLAAAAYLSKQGIPSLLCEQGDAIGGRCSTREINGGKYEIGAVYVGGGAFDLLRRTFGITCPTIPIRVGIRVGKGLASFPLGKKTLWELKRCGVSLGDLFRFIYRIRTLSNPSTFENCESVSEVLDRLTSNVEIRRFMDAMFGVSGVSPSFLPAHYLDGRSRVARYKAGNPEYIPGGNGEIPARLFEIAKKNCTFLLNTRVTEIIIDNGNVRGIKTDRGEFFGQVVVSNAGLRPTVLHLTQKKHWPEDYYLKVKEIKSSLKVVNIFLTFSRSIKLPAGMSVFLSAVDVDMEREFHSLASGSFSEQTMFILQVPSNVEPHSQGDHRGTLQFYYPAGEVSAQALESHVNRIMGEGLDTLFKGLSKTVTRYTVFDPARYEETFGFPPIVFGAAPDLHLSRFSRQTPVTGLYCVGDSVAPDGPCVPQALESGIACARNVLEVLSKQL